MLMKAKLTYEITQQCTNSKHISHEHRQVQNRKEVESKEIAFAGYSSRRQTRGFVDRKTGSGVASALKKATNSFALLTITGSWIGP
jgi:hypothetical protein